MSEPNTPASVVCQQQATTLQHLFEHIYAQRMQDMPIINPQITVETVGFQGWQADCLGVLITPWFMNLVILPSQPATELKVGQKLVYAFPAGEYDFVVNHEQPLGFFYTCSLFSPMFQFADHAAAHETAQAVIELLLKPQIQATDSSASFDDADQPAATVDKDSANASEISRRDLLRGRLRSD